MLVLYSHLLICIKLKMMTRHVPSTVSEPWKLTKQMRKPALCLQTSFLIKVNQQRQLTSSGRCFRNSLTTTEPWAMLFISFDELGKFKMLKSSLQSQRRLLTGNAMLASAMLEACSSGSLEILRELLKNLTLPDSMASMELMLWTWWLTFTWIPLTTSCIPPRRKVQLMRHPQKTWELQSLWSRSFSWETRTQLFLSAMAWCLRTSNPTLTKQTRFLAINTRQITTMCQYCLLSQFASSSRKQLLMHETISRSSNLVPISLNTEMITKRPGFFSLTSSLPITNTILQKNCSRSVLNTTSLLWRQRSLWES